MNESHAHARSAVLLRALARKKYQGSVPSVSSRQASLQQLLLAQKIFEIHLRASQLRSSHTFRKRGETREMRETPGYYSAPRA